MRRDQEMYFESLVLRSFKLYQEAKQPSAVLMSDYSYIDSVTRASLRGRKFVFKYPGSYDMIYWILANTANIALTSSRPLVLPANCVYPLQSQVGSFKGKAKQYKSDLLFSLSLYILQSTVKLV